MVVILTRERTRSTDAAPGSDLFARGGQVLQVAKRVAVQWPGPG